MMQTAAQSTPRLKPGSFVLWDAWFNAGYERLKEADQIRFDAAAPLVPLIEIAKSRALYANAKDWFERAIEQARGFPHDDHRLCNSFAGLAWACYWLGDHSESLQFACEAINCLNRQPKSSTDPPVTTKAAELMALAMARCQLIIGQCAFENGDHKKAEKHFRLAIRKFEEASPDNHDIGFLYEQIGIIQIGHHQFRAAIRTFGTAEEFLRRQDTQPLKRAFLIAKIADNLILDGQYRQAARKWSRWLSSFVSADQNWRDIKWAAYSTALQFQVAEGAIIFSGAFLKLGRLEQAQEAIDLADATLCGCHSVPDDLVVALLTQKTEKLRLEGCLAAAAKCAPCPDDYETLSPLVSLRAFSVRGDLFYDRGEYKEAWDSFVAAESLLPDVPGGRYTEELHVLLGQSRINTSMSQITVAAAQASKAFRLLEDNGRIAQLETGFALHDLSRSLLRDNRLEEALPLAERAHLLLTSTLGRHHPLEPAVLTTLAENAVTYRNVGSDTDEDTGLHYAAQAIDMVTEHYPGRVFDLARAHMIRGQLLHAVKRCHEAKHAFQCAVRWWNVGEKELKHDHCEKSWTIAALAALHIRLGFPQEAEDLYDSVLGLMLQMKLTQSAIAYEFNRLGNLYFGLQLWPESEWLYVHATALYAAEVGDHHRFTILARKNAELAAQRDIIEQTE